MKSKPKVPFYAILKAHGLSVKKPARIDYAKLLESPLPRGAASRLSAPTKLTMMSPNSPKTFRKSANGKRP